jgi:ribosomal protein L40E
MQSAVTRIPVASFQDHDKTGAIIIDHVTHAPFCEMCQSFKCHHVKYALTFKQFRINFKESVKLICSECGNYNSKDAKYCTQCGSKIRKVD